MGRHRKTDTTPKVKENIPPETQDIQGSGIDYGYPEEVLRRFNNIAIEKMQDIQFAETGEKLEGEELEFYKSEGLLAVKFYILHSWARIVRQYHAHWLALKLKSGWKYGEKLNIGERISPNLLPFHELSEKEKEKLAMFKAFVMGAVSDYLKE